MVREGARVCGARRTAQGVVEFVDRCIVAGICEVSVEGGVTFDVDRCREFGVYYILMEDLSKYDTPSGEVVRKLKGTLIKLFTQRGK